MKNARAPSLLTAETHDNKKKLPNTPSRRNYYESTGSSEGPGTDASESCRGRSSGTCRRLNFQTQLSPSQRGKKLPNTPNSPSQRGLGREALNSENNKFLPAKILAQPATGPRAVADPADRLGRVAPFRHHSAPQREDEECACSKPTESRNTRQQKKLPNTPNAPSQRGFGREALNSENNKFPLSVANTANSHGLKAEGQHSRGISASLVWHACECGDPCPWLRFDRSDYGYGLARSSLRAN
jgi:hypothetical protein